MNTNRIDCDYLKNRVMSAEQAAKFVESGMTVAFSGFSTGLPKVVPFEIAKLDVKNLTLLCGAALGPETFKAITDAGVLRGYVGFQFDPSLKNLINNGNIDYIDCHLGHFARKIRNGDYGKIDLSIIECAKINADGSIVPSMSIGMVNVLFECSEKIILELNSHIPLDIEGFHDVCGADAKAVEAVMERVGEPYYRCDTGKIAAIVETEEEELSHIFVPINEVYENMARNMVDCLGKEISEGRIIPEFNLQVGMGGVANSVLSCLHKGNYKNLKMYTEVFSDPALKLLEEGLITEVSTTCLDLSKEGIEKIFSNPAFYRDRIVIRSLERSNGAQSIQNMNVVSMNTAVEVDIYGNVNSTNVMGSNMIFGIGGSNDFARNAKLTVFLTPSTAKDGKISCIVPMVSHVDSSEHDTDIIVTEYGYADLRGLSPKKRAALLIEKCAHPDYRQQLRDYYNGAVKICDYSHTPHNLFEAFSMHRQYIEEGTMKAKVVSMHRQHICKGKMVQVETQ